MQTPARVDACKETNNLATYILKLAITPTGVYIFQLLAARNLPPHNIFRTNLQPL